MSTRLSRRRFVATAAAAVAVPYFLPRGVLAAPGRVGANDRIGIAGIGIGRQGIGVLSAAVKHKSGRFIGIADVNLPRAEQMAQKLGGGVACQHYRQILENKDVDAVVTATPEHWRVNICVEACQAGKDIYAEKPVSLTIREGRLMTEAARKHNRVFQVGSQQRSMPIDRAACEWIRAGGLGKISKVQYWNFPSPFEARLPEQPLPAGLDWNMWCGPAEVAPYNIDLYTPRAKPGWLSLRPYSGGEMTGWGAHGFDMVQYALGMDDSGPAEVWTEGPAFDPPTYTAAEAKKRGDAQCSQPLVFFRYAGGVLMEPNDKAPKFGGIFFGEKGSATVDRNAFKTNPPELAQKVLEGVPKTDVHIANWMECIVSRARPNADVEIAHRSATVCHMGNIARWTGRRLKWDAQAEAFDAAEANALCDRPRRKPFDLPAV